MVTPFGVDGAVVKDRIQGQRWRGWYVALYFRGVKLGLIESLNALRVDGLRVARYSAPTRNA